MRTKRFIASLLALLMLFSLMPTLALAEDIGEEDEGEVAIVEEEPEVPEDEETAEVEALPEVDEPEADPVAYDLWVAGVQVTDSNKNNIVTGVRFDSDTSTLTIQGNVGESLNNPENLTNGAVIYSELPDLTITTGANFTFASDTAEKLIYANGGNLTLKKTSTQFFTLSAESAYYGILVDNGNLTLDCHLDLTAPDAEYGIFVNGGNLLLDKVAIGTTNYVPVVFVHSANNGAGIFGGTLNGTTGLTKSVLTINGKRLGFNDPTLQGDTVTNAMVVSDGDLSLGGKLSINSAAAKYGIYAPGAVRNEGTLNVLLSSGNALVGISTVDGFTSTGNVTVDLYDNNMGYYGTGILAPDGAVYIDGNYSSSALIGIDCAGGDVTVTGTANIMTGTWDDGSCGIRTANGYGVTLGSLSQVGTINYAIYSDGDVLVNGYVYIMNGFPIGGEGIHSVNGSVSCKGTVDMGISDDNEFEDENLNATDVFIYAGGEGGIQISGNAFFNSTRAVEAPAALTAPNGPITIDANLDITGGGLDLILAGGDIRIEGNATLKNNLSATTVKPYNGRAMRSTGGSISVGGALKSFSSEAGISANNDVRIAGNATVGVSVLNERDYVIRAENGEIQIGGDLQTTGMAANSLCAGTSIQVEKNVTITNAAEDGIGMKAGGFITFVSGKWDVDAGAAALQAGNGIEIPEGYGVTLPEGGKVAVVDSLNTITEADGATIAAHAIIEEKEEAAIITIILDAVEGTVEPATVEITAGEAIGELPIPTREGGWKFIGWFTAAAENYMSAGQGTQVTAETTFDETSTIFAHWRLPGDINGDGSVNNKDVIRLQRHLKTGDVEVMTFNLDTNGDGCVNNKDVVRLQRFLKTGDVELH